MDNSVKGKISDEDMMEFFVILLLIPLIYLAILLIMFISDWGFHPVKALQYTWNELCNEWEWVTGDEVSFKVDSHIPDEAFDYF